MLHAATVAALLFSPGCSEGGRGARERRQAVWKLLAAGQWRHAPSLESGSGCSTATVAALLFSPGRQRGRACTTAPAGSLATACWSALRIRGHCCCRLCRLRSVDGSAGTLVVTAILVYHCTATTVAQVGVGDGVGKRCCICGSSSCSGASGIAGHQRAHTISR